MLGKDEKRRIAMTLKTKNFVTSRRESFVLS